MVKNIRRRFYVGASDKYSEIFSMLERKDEKNYGDIEIFTNRTGNSTLDLEDRQIKHEHFSVHRSLNSDGINISRTLNVGNKSFSTAAKVKKSKESGEKLLWLISSFSLTDLHDSFISINSKEKEKTIKLIDNYDDKWTLLCFIFVKSKNILFDSVEYFNLHVEEFEFFDIGIYTTYLFVRSSGVGFITAPLTSKVRIKDEHLGPFQKNEGFESLDPGKIKEILYEFCEDVSRNHTRRFVEKYIGYPKRKDLINNKASYIGTIAIDENNENYQNCKLLPWVLPLENNEEFSRFFRY